MPYALVPAYGYSKNDTRVISSHSSLESARKAAGKYKGAFRVQIVEHQGGLKKGRRFFMDSIGGTYPQRNPTRRKTARRKNAPKSQSKLLKNFTGVVRLNADKTVSIVGTGRKANPSKKRRAKR